MFEFLFGLALTFLAVSTAIVASSNDSTVAVTLDDATVIGITDGHISQFLGIPFALPPYACLLFSLMQLLYNHNFFPVSVIFGFVCLNFRATTLGS